MSRSIDLLDTVYAALEEAASTSSTTPAEWIAERLPQPAPVSEPERDGESARTLADRFEGYLGLVSLTETDLAQRHSELFAEGMVEKHREGRL